MLKKLFVGKSVKLLTQNLSLLIVLTVISRPFSLSDSCCCHTNKDEKSLSFKSNLRAKREAKIQNYVTFFSTSEREGSDEYYDDGGSNEGDDQWTESFFYSKNFEKINRTGDSETGGLQSNRYRKFVKDNYLQKNKVMNGSKDKFKRKKFAGKLDEKRKKKNHFESTKSPDTRTEASDIRTEALDTLSRASDIRTEALDTLSRASDTRTESSDTRSRASDTHNIQNIALPSTQMLPKSTKFFPSKSSKNDPNYKTDSSSFRIRDYDSPSTHEVTKNYEGELSDFYKPGIYNTKIGLKNSPTEKFNQTANDSIIKRLKKGYNSLIYSKKRKGKMKENSFTQNEKNPLFLPNNPQKTQNFRNDSRSRVLSKKRPIRNHRHRFKLYGVKSPFLRRLNKARKGNFLLQKMIEHHEIDSNEVIQRNPIQGDDSNEVIQANPIQGDDSNEKTQRNPIQGDDSNEVIQGNPIHGNDGALEESVIEIGRQINHKDSTEISEGLDENLNENPNEHFNEHLDEDLDGDLNENLDEDLGGDLNEDLDLGGDLNEDLDEDLDGPSYKPSLGKFYDFKNRFHQNFTAGKMRKNAKKSNVVDQQSERSLNHVPKISLASESASTLRESKERLEQDENLVYDALPRSQNGKNSHSFGNEKSNSFGNQNLSQFVNGDMNNVGNENSSNIGQEHSSNFRNENSSIIGQEHSINFGNENYSSLLRRKRLFDFSPKKGPTRIYKFLNAIIPFPFRRSKIYSRSYSNSLPSVGAGESTRNPRNNNQNDLNLNRLKTYPVLGVKSRPFRGLWFLTAFSRRPKSS